MTRSRFITQSLILCLVGLVLAGCEPNRAPPVDSGTAIVPEEPPLQIKFVIELGPTEPPPRPSASELHLPEGCSAEESATALVVVCPDGGLEAHWNQSPPLDDRLDDWTLQTMVKLKGEGVPMVLLGEPTCTVQNEAVPCTRVLARSEHGVESTLFLAVGSSPEGGSVEVICQWSGVADEPTYQGLCQQVLRRI